MVLLLHILPPVPVIAKGAAVVIAAALALYQQSWGPSVQAAVVAVVAAAAFAMPASVQAR